MQLPNNFQSTIANTFYDKTVSILEPTKTTETDGAVTYTGGYTVKGNFKGNPRLVNFKKIQKEYGLDYQIDIAITCGVDTSVFQEDILEYNGVRYEVTDVLPFDSHKLIVGAKWQRQ